MKIALLGTFDIDNYGDCLFPYVFESALSIYNTDVDVSCFSPDRKKSELLGGRKLYGIAGEVSDAQFRASLKDYDAVVLAGGDTLWSGVRSGTYCKLPIKEMCAGMRLWGWQFIAEQELNRKGVILASGVGYLPESTRQYVKENFHNLTYFSVRDGFSAARIDSKVSVDPDIVFVLPKIIKESDCLAVTRKYIDDEKYIVFQFSITYDTAQLESVISQVIEIVKEEEATLLLLPLCRFLGDQFLLSSLMKNLDITGINFKILDVRSSFDMMAILACSSGFIGTSLHGAITAFSMGKKALILSNKTVSKHRGVFDVVGGSDDVIVESFDSIKKYWNKYDLEKQRERATNAADKVNAIFAILFEKLNILREDGVRMEGDLESLLDIEVDSVSFLSRMKIYINRCFHSNQKVLARINYTKYKLFWKK